MKTKRRIPLLSGLCIVASASIVAFYWFRWGWPDFKNVWTWILLLGLSQGASLGLGIFFTMARAPDPVSAASLSGLAQGWGYLLATVGPLAVGLLHASTGGWDVPVAMLLALCGAQLAAGWLAARAQVLPLA